MTATFLSSELTSLVSESKRKNAELRNAAEKSLQELKSLPTTSEQQVVAGKPTLTLSRTKRTLTDKRPQSSPGIHRTLSDCLRDTKREVRW